MDGTPTIKLDVSQLIREAIEGTLSLFGRDSLSQDLKNKIELRLDRMVRIASHIHCVGMPEPIQIHRIYQPTRLADARNRRISVFDILSRSEGAVIMADPGFGKTTLLHWLFCFLLTKKTYVPVLFSLRSSEAINDLEEFITALARRKTIKPIGSRRIALLVDGYDEVSQENQQRVSSLILTFATHKCGAYLVTCRSYYRVYDVPAPRLFIRGFSSEDSANFLSSFLGIYGVTSTASEVVDELKAKGLGSFLQSPLLMTLVCIIRLSPDFVLPRNPLGLIKQAVNVLTWRWDAAKGFDDPVLGKRSAFRRISSIALDGDSRVQLLMRIAFEGGVDIGEEPLLRLAHKHLKLRQRRDIEVHKLMLEIAQWYGIFIPQGDTWTFAHKSIRDYLAARYWVETGRFRPTKLTRFDATASYAACLTQDATPFLRKCLIEGAMSAFIECIINDPPLDVDKVSKMLVEYYLAREHDADRKPSRTPVGAMDPVSGDFVVDLGDEDFYGALGEELLFMILDAALKAEKSSSGLAIACVCQSELRRRGVVVPQSLLVEMGRRVASMGRAARVRRKSRGFFVDAADSVRRKGWDGLP